MADKKFYIRVNIFNKPSWWKKECVSSVGWVESAGWVDIRTNASLFCYNEAKLLIKYLENYVGYLEYYDIWMETDNPIGSMI